MRCHLVVDYSSPTLCVLRSPRLHLGFIPRNILRSFRSKGIRFPVVVSSVKRRHGFSLSLYHLLSNREHSTVFELFGIHPKETRRSRTAVASMQNRCLQIVKTVSEKSTAVAIVASAERAHFSAAESNLLITNTLTFPC